MRVFKLIATVLILGLLLAACSSDKKDNGTNQQEQPPEGITIDPVQLPAGMTQSSDQYAQTVVSYINLINMFQYWTGSLVPPGQVGKVGLVESTTDGPPWEYTWSQQGITVKLVIDIQDNQYHWVLTYSGTFEGYQYNNAKVLEAWQDMDGTSGKLVVFNKGMTIIAATRVAWRRKAMGKAIARRAFPFSALKKESLKISGISSFGFVFSAIFLTSFYFDKLHSNTSPKV